MSQVIINISCSSNSSNSSVNANPNQEVKFQLGDPESAVIPAGSWSFNGGRGWPFVGNVTDINLNQTKNCSIWTVRGDASNGSYAYRVETKGCGINAQPYEGDIDVVGGDG